MPRTASWWTVSQSTTPYSTPAHPGFSHVTLEPGFSHVTLERLLTFPANCFLLDARVQVTASTLVGAILYAMLEPCLPHVDPVSRVGAFLPIFHALGQSGLSLVGQLAQSVSIFFVAHINWKLSYRPLLPAHACSG